MSLIALLGCAEGGLTWAENWEMLALTDDGALIDVRFTRVPESQQEEVQQFMCPVSRDIFGPTSKLVLLRPTGDVLLESSYNTAVKPEASYRGVPIQETDVITLKAGRNTGFAHANNVEASKSYMVGRGSGLADLRGQGGSAPSRFALSM